MDLLIVSFNGSMVNIADERGEKYTVQVSYITYSSTVSLTVVYYE